MSNVWNDGFYTEEQIVALTKIHRKFVVSGNPQHAIKLILQMEAHVPFAELEIPGEQKKSLPVRPETTVDTSLVDIPPRHGNGSSKAAWAEFAKLVSDMDEEVIDQFTRGEIIEILEQRDIIDPESH